MPNVDVRDLVMGAFVLGAVVLNSAVHPPHPIRVALDWPTIRELLGHSIQDGTACTDDPTICIQFMILGP